MKTRHLFCIGAFASAVCAGGAFAADASVTTTQIQNGPSTTTAQNRVAPGARSVGGSERMDNTNGGPASAYTPVPQWSDFDVPTNFPTRNLSLPPRTGSDVIPDYMGPGSVRGQ